MARFRRLARDDEHLPATVAGLHLVASLADNAARTVALLTETLNRHRSRGQQHITVRHVTVNADQAVVTDQLVTSIRSQGGGQG